MSFVFRICFAVVLWAQIVLSLSGCNENSPSATSATSSQSTPVPPITEGDATATVTWVTPAEPATVSSSAPLLGFHIYYGTSPSALTHLADVADVTVNSYEIKNLSSGRWYFAVAEYDADEVESARSPTIAATL